MLRTNRWSCTRDARLAPTRRHRLHPTSDGHHAISTTSRVPLRRLDGNITTLYAHTRPQVTHGRAAPRRAPHSPGDRVDVRRVTHDDNKKRPSLSRGAFLVRRSRDLRLFFHLLHQRRFR